MCLQIEQIPPATRAAVKQMALFTINEGKLLKKKVVDNNVSVTPREALLPYYNRSHRGKRHVSNTVQKCIISNPLFHLADNPFQSLVFTERG